MAPAALEAAINDSNHESVKAQIILELANGPLTPDADEYFARHDVVVIPDVLANAGGVAVSYYEWLQNRSGEHWTKAQVLDKLKTQMESAVAQVLKTQNKYQVSLREAAYILALRRLEQSRSPRDQ